MPRIFILSLKILPTSEALVSRQVVTPQLVHSAVFKNFFILRNTTFFANVDCIFAVFNFYLVLVRIFGKFH